MRDATFLAAMSVVCDVSALFARTDSDAATLLWFGAALIVISVVCYVVARKTVDHA